MSLLERVMAEPELREAPPVLVDVGAAGGVHPGWRRIARYAVGVGFEPDAREAAPLGAAQREFKKWIFCPGLAVPEQTADGQAALHLTQSPQCSSTLAPKAAELDEWSFSGFFTVMERRRFSATTLREALVAQGIDRVDWLKCDTQGLDLKLWQSLPAEWRARTLAVEVEPGIIDAYEGEEKLGDVLGALAGEPFWLADLTVGRVARGRLAVLEKYLGAGAARWVRRLAPGAPAWANAHFLRDFARATEALDRRAYLLGWVWATLAGQHSAALMVAHAGVVRFSGGIFAAMAAASARSLRWSMVRGLPAMLGRRLWRA